MANAMINLDGEEITLEDEELAALKKMLKHTEEEEHIIKMLENYVSEALRDSRVLLQEQKRGFQYVSYAAWWDFELSVRKIEALVKELDAFENDQFTKQITGIAEKLREVSTIVANARKYKWDPQHIKGLPLW